MRNLFVLILIFGFLCIFVLFQRRHLTQKATSWQGRRVRSLKMVLSHQQQERSDVVLDRLRRTIADRLYTLLNVLDFKDKKVFVRNLLIPAAGAVGVVMVNSKFVGLPLMWVAPAGAVTAYTVFFAMLSKRRRKEFNLNFSEALTTLNGAISSGRTFLQAMADYALISDSKLAHEFGVISRRLNMGENADQVFHDSWQNYPYREYYFFIVAILLNVRGGGRLKEVLLKLQRSIATGVAMEKKMLSMTSEMRMASKITGAIPFIFLLILKFINPQDFEYVIYHEEGKAILYYLLGSVATGAAILKFLMRGI